ncbi:hypothetical protein CDD83_2993 [Cordyceps sp. RAO-2017]|nr:hypothetical protein CDD83_2993 [Cordyceps sp. RAO-2017]
MENDRPGGSNLNDLENSTLTSANSTTSDENTGNDDWKPLSIRGPILGTLVVVSLLMAAATELLARRSQAHGGLALVPSLRVDDIPRSVAFAYRYVPNIVATVYGLAWSWVDLDVRRMQPWFELSKKNGASGRDTLFLDYPSQFLAFVPWTSSRRRHWPVFFSSVISILALWALIPLQGTIFKAGIVTRTQPMNIVNRTRFAPTVGLEQEKRLSPEILHIAYGIGWLKQPYLPFTTSEFALLPYYVDGDPAPDGSRSQANWTAATTKVWSELTCSPAKALREYERLGDSYFVWMDDSCVAHGRLSTTPGEYDIFFRKYNLKDKNWLSHFSPECPDAADRAHLFYAIFLKDEAHGHSTPFNTTADDSTSSGNMTAITCRSHYYKQDVMITSGHNARPYPDTIQPLSNKQLLNESEFNSTAFEDLIISGYQHSSRSLNGELVSTPRTASVAEDVLVPLRVKNRPGRDGGISFLLAGPNIPLDAYQNPRAFGEALNRGLQYVFAIAASKILVNETVSSHPTAQSTYPQAGIVVSRLFSAVAESLLVLIAILAASLGWLCYRAPCHLRSNPNSISRLIDIVRNSPGLLDAFRVVDHIGEKKLVSLFRNDIFRLSPLGGRGPHIEREVFDDDVPGEQGGPSEREVYYEPVRPWALSPLAGTMFLIILLGAIVFLSWAKGQEVSQNGGLPKMTTCRRKAIEFSHDSGLHHPTGGPEVRQLLEKYIPTAFATLLQPYWSLVSRLLCTIQPFRALASGGAQPAKSIETTCSAIPSQLAFWRAVKARHFVLAAVCLTAIVSSILGIGMAALFSERMITVEHVQNFTSIHAISTSFIRNIRFTPLTWNRDMLSHAEANLSYGAPLPPWASPAYFFHPYEVAAPKAEGVYTLQTQGFGADLDCTPMVARSQPFSSDALSTAEYEAPNCSSGLADPIGVASLQSRFWWLASGIKQPGPFAFDIRSSFELNSIKEGNECQSAFILGWGRVLPPTDNNATFDLSIAACRPIVGTALFNVTVDVEGNVISYLRTSDAVSGEVSNKTTLLHSLLNDQITLLTGIKAVTPTDTEPGSWLSFLQICLTGSPDFLDPGKPIPDPVQMISTVRNIFRLTFALGLSLGRNNLFENTTSANVVAGTRSSQETKIFFNSLALGLSLVILSIDVVIAIFIYTCGTISVLPRLPTSLGSIIAYIAPSSITFVPVDKNKTVSFGRFVGVGGSAHIGIEVDPLVIPIHPSPLPEGTSLIRRLACRSRRQIAVKAGRSGG